MNDRLILTHKKISLVEAIMILLLLVGGCAMSNPSEKLEEALITGPKEPLYLKGDLVNWLNVAEIWHEMTLVQAPMVDGLEITSDCVELSDLLEKGDEIYEDNDVYLIADDGFMIRMDDTTIEGTYVTYDETQGWSYLSNKHPVNSKIKRIREIILVAKDSESVELNYRGIGFNVINEGKDTWSTRGQLLMMQNEVISRTDGVSSFNDIKIDVMKRHHGISLYDLVGDEVEQLMLLSEDGGQHYVNAADGIIEVSESFITYIDRESYDKIHHVLGSVVNPPQVRITDNFYDAEHYLSKDIPVMTLFLDGFSYDQYIKIKQMNPSLYISTLDYVREATSVYKPVTNAGFSAMITGVLPTVNGVHDRSDREPLVETIFDRAENLGKQHLLVEGDIGILRLNTVTLINLDENDNGYTDDEIYHKAMDNLDQGYDYMMVHFHSIDEFGHDYGPYNEVTMKQIAMIDGYVKAISDQWHGMIILTSDHGMHGVDGAGDHGLMVAEDMRVPYVVIDARD